MGDYRDTLPDAMNQPWRDRTEFDPVAYQLIDGLDLMVEPSGRISRWGGFAWSPLRNSLREDREIEKAIEIARTFGTIDQGWHVLTGPGIESRSTGLINPYDFIKPMLLPVKLLKLKGDGGVDFLKMSLSKYYLSGVLVVAMPFLAVSFRNDFVGSADLIEMTQRVSLPIRRAR